MVGDKTVIGLDIGTVSTRCVIASIDREGEMVIEALSERPSEGVKKGAVVNIEQTVKVINGVLQDAELQSGVEVNSVILATGGETIGSIQSNGVVGINSKDQEIKNEDIKRSIDVAKNRALPQNTEIIHTLVQDFEVDGQVGIKDPIDMIAHRLDTKVLLVTGSTQVIQNQKKCLQKCGLLVKKLVLQQLADAEVVLFPEEKENGTILIDIGAGSTNCIVYESGAPRYVGGISFGGENVTADIAYLLQIPKVTAESIKITDGTCFSPNVPDDEMIITPQVGGKPSIRLPRKELAQVIEARMAEIFALLKQKLEENGINCNKAHSVILVGGGALLSGAADLASEIFRLPARIGFPEAISGLDRNYIDPRYTAVLGLIKRETKRFRDGTSFHNSKEKSGIKEKMKNFFSKLF